MKNRIVCFLDKEDPPEHSFVDGMLAGALPQNSKLRVYLLVSRKGSTVPFRYKDAVCLPLLLSRRGINRFLNYFLIFIFMRLFSKKYRKNNITYFVRNEPIYLLAVALHKKSHQRLIFQQSFPHEKFRSGWIKQFLAKLFIRLSASRVNAILTVSQLGLDRLRKYFKPSTPGLVIPLLNDNSDSFQKNILNNNDENRSIKFIYIGAHDIERQLEVVISGIYLAVKSGVNASFDFIGGRTEDVNRLRNLSNTQALEHAGILSFRPKLRRSELLQILPQYDVGICLIPPVDIYKESSPTKLAEYMGAGVAILASRGIPIQEEFIENSGAGVLVEWSVESISAGIVNLAKQHANRKKMAESGFVYARSKLNYQAYTNDFLDLI